MTVDHALHVFKRAQRGLFAGKTRLVGNSISASKRHTKRAWVPNVQRKRLFSATLGRQLTVSVTTSALRTIDRFGGLDEYVLRSQQGQLRSEFGERLRRTLLAHQEGSRRFEARVAARAAAAAAAAATAGGRAAAGSLLPPSSAAAAAAEPALR